MVLPEELGNKSINEKTSQLNSCTVLSIDNLQISNQEKHHDQQKYQHRNSID